MELKLEAMVIYDGQKASQLSFEQKERQLELEKWKAEKRSEYRQMELDFKEILDIGAGAEEKVLQPKAEVEKGNDSERKIRPKDVQKPGEAADFISHIRKPIFSEGKVVRKTWEDTNKNPGGQFKNQQKVGGHFVGKPDPNQIRNQNLEGKGVKSSVNDQMNFRICFRCGEKGHISTQCGKNRDVELQ